MNEKPFEPGDLLRSRSGGRALKYVGEAPNRPGYVVCEYWGPITEGSRCLPLIREEIPLTEVRRYQPGIISIRTR